MIVRILTRFHDKDNFTKVYEVDDVVDFEPKRALELIKLSLVMEVDQQSPKDSGKKKIK